jgi:hypothetical protein
MGKLTRIIYVSDLDQTEIEEGEVLKIEVLHPDGTKQELDVSRKNFAALGLYGVGKFTRKRGRKSRTAPSADAVETAKTEHPAAVIDTPKLQAVNGEATEGLKRRRRTPKN